MKKKLLLIAAAALLCLSASAQEAFKHLSIGVEAGTAGAGVELAFPLVTNHLVLTAGYQFPSVNFNLNTTFPTSELKKVVDDANNTLASAGLSDRLTNNFGSNTNVTTDAQLNLGAVKAMLEFYPSARSNFHITAGLFFGVEDFLSADMYTEKSFWTSIKGVESEIGALKQKYSDIPEVQKIDGNLTGQLKANVNGKTYQLKEKDGCGYLNAGLEIAKVRPYVGLGFGRSIPKTHFGFQFDMGVWFHGTPSLSSTNEVAFDSGAQTISDLDEAIAQISKFTVYPSVALRLIYRIF